MMKKAIPHLCGVTLALLSGCGASSTAESPAGLPTITVTASEAAAAAPSTATPVESVVTPIENVAEKNSADADAPETAAPISILLQGDAIVAEGSGVTVDRNIVTVTDAGVYNISGSLANGQIVVDTEDEEAVRLILNGVDIHNETGAAIAVFKAEQAVIELAAGTNNVLSDGAEYVFADPEDDEPDATLFSKVDLLIEGDGGLTVKANYNDGIGGRDDVVISGGLLDVTAVDDGIRGKDSLTIEGGNITVIAQGDGLKSDNDEDAEKGIITIQAGEVQIAAGSDAMQAETNISIIDGTFVLSSGGGSQAALAEDASAKGIKAGSAMVIDGGVFTIDSADDAIHANGTVTINDGAFVIASGDDGIHADVELTINAGDIQIAESYEGIESAIITINDGTIRVVADDDGINVAGGNDAGAMPGGPGGPRGPQDNFAYTGNEWLYIHGGYIVVDAAGDGIDVNGAIDLTDGIVIVNGPTMDMNGALDYDGSFNLTGGFLAAAGSAGMAQAPGAGSTQPVVLINFEAVQAAGTAVHVETAEGDALFTFVPTKQFQSIAFSSPALVAGAAYTVYLGGSATGAAQDGLWQDGGYTPGTQYAGFTVENVVTTLGQSRLNRRR